MPFCSGKDHFGQALLRPWWSQSREQAPRGALGEHLPQAHPAAGSGRTPCRPRELPGLRWRGRALPQGGREAGGAGRGGEAGPGGSLRLSGRFVAASLLPSPPGPAAWPGSRCPAGPPRAATATAATSAGSGSASSPGSEVPRAGGGLQGQRWGGERGVAVGAKEKRENGD